VEEYFKGAMTSAESDAFSATGDAKGKTKLTAKSKVKIKDEFKDAPDAEVDSDFEQQENEDEVAQLSKMLSGSGGDDLAAKAEASPLTKGSMAAIGAEAFGAVYREWKTKSDTWLRRIEQARNNQVNQEVFEETKTLLTNLINGKKSYLINVGRKLQDDGIFDPERARSGVPIEQLEAMDAARESMETMIKVFGTAEEQAEYNIWKTKSMEKRTIVSAPDIGYIISWQTKKWITLGLFVKKMLLHPKPLTMKQWEKYRSRAKTRMQASRISTDETGEGAVVERRPPTQTATFPF